MRSLKVLVKRQNIFFFKSTNLTFHSYIILIGLCNNLFKNWKINTTKILGLTLFPTSDKINKDFCFLEYFRDWRWGGMREREKTILTKFFKDTQRCNMDCKNKKRVGGGYYLPWYSSGLWSVFLFPLPTLWDQLIPPRSWSMLCPARFCLFP